VLGGLVVCVSAHTQSEHVGSSQHWKSRRSSRKAEAHSILSGTVVVSIVRRGVWGGEGSLSRVFGGAACPWRGCVALLFGDGAAAALAGACVGACPGAWGCQQRHLHWVAELIRPGCVGKYALSTCKQGSECDQNNEIEANRGKSSFRF